MGIPFIEGEIEIDLTEVIGEGSPHLGISEREFEKLMGASGPQEPLELVKGASDESACECCNRTDRKLWNGVCAWCCP